MNFGKWFGVAVLWLGCGLAARAQFGAYVMYSASELSGIQCFDPQGLCSGAGGKVKPSGLFGGMYYDFRDVGPVRLGVDVRGGRTTSNKSATSSGGGDNATGSNQVLAGVRGSIHTPITWIRPYAEIAAGWASSNATEPFGPQTLSLSIPTTPPRAYDNFVQYEGLVGVDLKILPVVDLRPIELGLGNMSRVGSGLGSSSAFIKTIGFGLVFHMPSN